MSDPILGWKLDLSGRAELLARFPPVYAETVADHVTFGRKSKAPAMPAAGRATVVGRADDGRGVEALVVEINGMTGRWDGGTFHITWSLGPAREAKESNDVIAAQGWEPAERGLAAALHLVGEALVLVQGLHARRLDGGDVDEAVRAAVFRSDEAIAFVGVEEFDCADRHDVFLSRTLGCPARGFADGAVVLRVVNRKEVVVRGRALASGARAVVLAPKSVAKFDVSELTLARSAGKA